MPEAVQGMSQLLEAFDKKGAELKDLLENEALSAGGEIVRLQAQANAVKGPTGELRNGMTKKIKNGTVEIGPSKKAWYAHLVEFGTSTTRAQPFLLSAMLTRQGDALRTMGNVLKRGL